jgi:methylated-DNA-[protein]-cysteine S-methyltransferase
MKFHASTQQCRIDTPLGPMVLAASELGLCGAWFDGQRHQPDAGGWPHAVRHPVLQQAEQQLAAYFAGTLHAFTLPLDLTGGTAFQQAVWRGLLGIAPGQTTSYGALSRQIGYAAAVRAVGAAIGRNPVSVIVPCHRVVGAGGALTGYAGGLPRKTALLALEAGAGGAVGDAPGAADALGSVRVDGAAATATTATTAATAATAATVDVVDVVDVADVAGSDAAGRWRRAA